MKYTKKIALCLIFALFINALSISGFDVQEQSKMEWLSQATWSEMYSSNDEMLSAADIVVIGEVVSQTLQQRHDLIFTLQNIEITEILEGSTDSSMVSVLQTGGNFNGIYTPPISEAPLLDIGDTYVLALSYVESDVYGEYYIIMGGYQGVAKFDSTPLEESAANAISILDDNFISLKDNRSSLRAANTTTPMLLWWAANKTTITCYISPSISTNYGSTISSQVTAAMNSWRNKCSKSFQSTTGVTFDVGVFMNNYGVTGWDGMMTPNYIGNEITYAGVSLNNLGQAIGSNYWQAVACHELGHAMGLDHNEWVSSSSIMTNGTPSYYNGTTKLTYTPQTDDINGLIANYGS
ncbi:MAG: matrixin family metalloprotease [Oscillospiraceae bacterium]|jgi:hypothetical protein|nr:matrixin family metalloprotease [Oscillospiraceae bacterium]